MYELLYHKTRPSATRHVYGDIEPIPGQVSPCHRRTNVT
jgi:hypothetical protein